MPRETFFLLQMSLRHPRKRLRYCLLNTSQVFRNICEVDFFFDVKGEVLNASTNLLDTGLGNVADSPIKGKKLIIQISPKMSGWIFSTS